MGRRGGGKVHENTDPEWKSKLANALVNARGTMRQLELAQKSGISDRTISQLENGKLERLPRIHTIIQLACALDIDPLEWLQWLGGYTSPERVDRMIASFKSAVETKDLEPAAKIKEEMKKWFEEKLATWNPIKTNWRFLKAVIELKRDLSDEEIEFLWNTQLQMKKTLTPEVISGLLECRK